MRPLKLIISGFGTYCNKTEIDMSVLGTSGLYLITGNTGSGKTTIFDAITYALYNSPSGTNRNVSMLRCNFATPEIPTFVELTFEFREKTYYVKRNPEYIGKGEKKDSVKKKSESILKLPDGKIITGDKAVTHYITELLGIDKEQFTQIAMISQGDFLKLLLASTEDRIKIFRQIYKTHRYENLTLNLKDEFTSLKNEVSDLSKELSQFYSDVNCDESDKLLIELSKLKENPGHWEDKINLIKKILKSDEEKFSKIEKKLSDNESEASEITKQLTKANEYKKLVDSLEEKNIELEEKKEKIVLEKNYLEELKNKEPEIEQKQGQIVLLKNQLSQFDNIEKKQKQIDDVKNVLNDSKKLLENLKLEKDKKTKELVDNKSQLETLSFSGENAEKIKSDIKSETEILKSLQEIKTQISSFHELEEQLKKVQNDFEESYSAFQESQNEYNKKNKAYLDDIAGILSESLQENEPCPVCGSKNHPHLATKSESAPTKQELEELELKVKSDSEKYTKINEKAALLKGQRDNMSTLIQEKLKKVDCTEISLTEKIDFIQNKINVLNEESEKYQNEIKIKDNLLQKIPTLEKSLDDISGQLNKLITQIAENQVFISTEEENLQLLTKNLDYKTRLEVKQTLERFEIEVSSFKNEFNEKQEDFNKCNDYLNNLKGTIKSLNDQILSYEKIDVSNLIQKQNKLEDENKQYTTELQKIYSRIQINKNSLGNISEKSDKLVTLENQLMMVENLYKTCIGDLGNGKVKIKLETYVQMAYFDRILAFANKRLMIMTSGQYELVRREDSLNHKSQFGLDLDVIDHYNGGVRAVNSLSGGESFEASLSLALGLSDEITHSAGGIKIDTMFVDEGFGTLDSDTIQKAHKALLSITEGNKLVGIISHVDYLKENIERKIVITKDKFLGSNVEIKL